MMWIEENTPDRLVLKSRAIVLILFMLACCFLSLWFFAPGVVMPLFAKAAWTLAPHWADVSGLKNEGLRLEFALLFSLFFLYMTTVFMGQLFWSLLFNVDRWIEFDLPRNRLTVASRGLFRPPDRVFPFSAVRVSVEKTVAEGEEKTELSVTLPPLPGKAKRKEVWMTGFHLTSLSPEVSSELAAFIARAQAPDALSLDAAPQTA